jgi:hypothetical protein
MFLSILAAAAAIAGAPEPQAPAPGGAVLIECLVSGESLTDCQLVESNDLGSARGAAALKLAAQIQVPEAMALANPGRIRIRLNVNP